jgi:leucyl-tRNA synthetase
MNERIETLAKVAGYDMINKAAMRALGFDVEKFAELIVRECVGLTDQWPDTVRQVMSRQIKENFGVEE